MLGATFLLATLFLPWVIGIALLSRLIGRTDVRPPDPTP